MLMTPGPTAVPESVREAMGREPINPDIDPAFTEIYTDLCEKLSAVYDTDDELLVLGGEAILGLEAAIASLVSPGDDVLCLANGTYGDGFADFVESYGGVPTVVGADYDDPLPLDALEATLSEQSFSVATMVHCETPTGTLNDLEPALSLLHDHDVLTVVDAVSSVGGVPVPTEQMDICIGGSQKCFSAPPGLTTVSVSDDAWDAVEERDPRSFYTNLLPWKDVTERELFPYTHLSSNVVALDEALSLVVDEGIERVYARHEEAARVCRERGADLGLDGYPDASRSSPTVTAFHVPDRAKALQRAVADEHDVVLATGLGDLADDILRVGHMGYNADIAKVERTMDAIASVLDA